MERIDKFLDAFYAGSIGQRDLETLFDSFLNDAEVRDKRPEDAEIIIPLALARKDAKQVTSRIWRVAAAIVGILLLVGVVTTYVLDQQTRVYSTDENCDMICAEEWLNKTIETAL